ncbi:MAG: aquaporin [Candidatus Dormibacteria bacterium]
MIVSKKLAAEAVGTFTLVFFAVGSAVFGLPKIGAVGVALAFGFVLLALVYAIGPISGCHVNPAVTAGVVLAKRMRIGEGAAYRAAQVAGGVAAGALLKFFTSSNLGNVVDQTRKHPKFRHQAARAAVIEVRERRAAQ